MVITLLLLQYIAYLTCLVSFREQLSNFLLEINRRKYHLEQLHLRIHIQILECKMHKATNFFESARFCKRDYSFS